MPNYNRKFKGSDRTKLHKGKKSQRVFSENHESVGMAGEWAFGEMSGHWPDTKEHKHGDGGFDFIVPLRFSVDIKTARKPTWLIVEQGTVTADIYVLAKYSDKTDTAKMLGWEWGRVLEDADIKVLNGIRNHHIPARELRPMKELENRIMRLR